MQTNTEARQRKPNRLRPNRTGPPGPQDPVLPGPAMTSRRAVIARLRSPSAALCFPTASDRLQSGSGGDGEPRSRGGDERSGSVIGRGGLRDGLAGCIGHQSPQPRQSEGDGDQRAEAEGARQVPPHQSHLHGQRRSRESEYRVLRGAGPPRARATYPLGSRAVTQQPEAPPPLSALLMGACGHSRKTILTFFNLCVGGSSLTSLSLRRCLEWPLIFDCNLKAVK